MDTTRFNSSISGSDTGLMASGPDADGDILLLSADGRDAETVYVYLNRQAAADLIADLARRLAAPDPS